MALITRDEIVAEARTWLGTPFMHQQTTKGVGVDCAGVLRGVMMAKGLQPSDVAQWPGAARFLAYGRTPDGASLLAACDAYLTRIPASQMLPGDVVVVAFDADPQHVGILGDYRHGGLSIIHALGITAKRVVETRLLFTSAMRFVAAYHIPGVV